MSATTVSATLLEPILQMAKHHRLDPSQYYQLAGLTEADFTRPGARFPVTHYKKLLAKLADSTANPIVGLSLGEATQPRMLGVTGFLISSASTLGKAYQALSQYLPILFEGATLTIEPTRDGTLLSLDIPSADQAISEYKLACLANWPRWLTGQQIPVKSIELAFAPATRELPYQRFFAAEVQFNASANRILIDSRYLERPCIDANAEMFQLHREFADSVLGRSNQPGALVAQTRSLIRIQLADAKGAVRREAITEALGMSLRTLQRKLGLLDTSFQQIYDQTRREYCLQLIQRGQLSFGEIAYQLGFSNQSAFQKAFKRWMGMAPSHYRQRLTPTKHNSSEQARSTDATIAPWTQQADAQLQLEQRLAKLSIFSQELLKWASLLQQPFELQQLGQVSDNPLARLSIHLWPAEQLGLIKPASDSDQLSSEHSRYQFSASLVQERLAMRLTDAERTQRHHRCGQLRLDELGPKPSLQQLQPLLEHYQQALELASIDERRQLLRHCQRAATLAEQQQAFAAAAAYLDQACQLLPTNQQGRQQQLQLQRCRLLVQAAQLAEAEAGLAQLDQSLLTTEEKIAAERLAAELLQCQGQPQRGLGRLLTCLAQHDQPLPDQPQQQLDSLLEQLQWIEKPHLSPVSERFDNSTTQLLQLLLQISRLAQRLAQPLLSACAIGRLTQLELSQPDNRVKAFSFSSYAWVASWFCGHYASARRFAERGLEAIQADKSAAAEALLVQCAQVQHWFWPLDRSRQLLQQLDQQTEQQGQWLVQAEGRLLSSQLELLGSRPLPELQPQWLRQQQQLLDQSQLQQAGALSGSVLRLTDQLQGRQPPTTEVNYQDGWQALCALISALLLEQHHSWPTLCNWELHIDNEQSGYYGASEALFLITVLRLLQAQRQAGSGYRLSQQVKLVESRFALWAEHCPDNFNYQLQLLRAEQQRLQGEDPCQAYERSLQAAERQNSLFHKSFGYERYGDYLATNAQPRLADYCLDQAGRLYRHWGATVKADQLAQRRRLLAQ